MTGQVLTPGDGQGIIRVGSVQQSAVQGMEKPLSQTLFFGARAPVPASEARIVSVGVNPLDRRRVDVAVDLTPCQEPVTVKLAIVGPDDEEWASTAVVQNREPELDRIVHLRRDAEPGEYILHVGLFCDEDLVHHVARRFSIRAPAAG
jgi:hypothetical protein